jgi:hypothetical protein
MTTKETAAVLYVEFAEHVPHDSMRSVVTGIAAYGNVLNGSSERSFIVEVFRASNLPRLKDRLRELERYGTLHWFEDVQTSN